MPASIQHISYPKPKPAIVARPKVPPKPARKAPRRVRRAVKSRAEVPAEAEGLKRGAAPSAREWVDIRTVGESTAVAIGLGLLLFSFFEVRGVFGSSLGTGGLAGWILLIVVGVIPTLLGLRGAGQKVRAGAGIAFACAGLIMVIFSFLATYGLMGQTPRLENMLWLGIMIAIGSFVTKIGVPLTRELEREAKEIWGGIFAGAGLAALVLCALTVHGLLGKVPVLENLTWLLIMVVLSAFLLREGIPPLLEYKDRFRTAWEGALLAAGAAVLLSCALPAYGMTTGTPETLSVFEFGIPVDVVWTIILIVIGAFLLRWGLKLARK